MVRTLSQRNQNRQNRLDPFNNVLQSNKKTVSGIKMIGPMGIMSFMLPLKSISGLRDRPVGIMSFMLPPKGYKWIKMINR